MQGVTTGDANETPPAMVNLGILEAEQGRAEEARRWFRAAIDSGHPNQAAKAHQLIADLDHREAKRGGERIGPYGWQNWSDH